jgi:large subunit ribosomal protein L24e
MPSCSFCKNEVPVGNGVTVFKRDGTPVRYCSRKCEKNAKLGRNPRKLKWTKKGQ